MRNLAGQQVCHVLPCLIVLHVHVRVHRINLRPGIITKDQHEERGVSVLEHMLAGAEVCCACKLQRRPRTVGGTLLTTKNRREARRVKRGAFRERSLASRSASSAVFSLV